MRTLASAFSCVVLAGEMSLCARAAGQGLLTRPAFPLGQGPKILYDIGHRNPSHAEGRYAAVADLLRSDGYQIIVGSVPSNRRELDQYRLVMIVMPYASNPFVDPSGAAAPVFAEGECDSLAAWVRDGGSLLLVVGHAPSGAANANLARRFGVELRNSTTMDSTPANNWVDGDPGCLGCLKFTLGNKLLRAHPITLGRDSSERVTSVMSAAGQSLGVASERFILLALGSAAYDVLPGGENCQPVVELKLLPCRSERVEWLWLEMAPF